MHLQVGTFLQGGKYRIEKVLGQGGFGITYLATQEFFDRHVCIKEFFFKDYCERGSQGEVTSCTTSNKDLVNRFLNKFIKEARTISRLDHPNIVRILDIFQENGTAYYAMEYIDGCSLADKVNAQGALSEAVAVDYIKQVADALDCIHQRSINHLDVKPANIMVRQSDNKAILIDFGLSKQYDEQGGQTSTTPVGISHGYAPMEQYNQGGVSTFSPQTDIYALGATLYKLVTCSTPPQAIEVFNEGLTGLPQSLSPNLEFAIKKTMQPRRNDRPQSISEFRALLGGQFSSNVSSSTTQNSDDESTRVIGEDTSNELAKKEKASQSIVTKVKAKEESSSKKWLWFLVVFVVAVLAIVLWPKGNNDLEVYYVPTEANTLPVEVNDSVVVDVAFSIDTVAVVDVEKVQPTTTSLYVTTTPSGVSVYVDGQKIGTTPIEGVEISCGSHKVKLSKTGYQDKTFTRTFGDKPVIINETLVEAPKANSSTTYGSKKTQTKEEAEVEAMRLRKLSAEQGDAAAQYNLGICYYNGQGVAQDYVEAVRWFRKAAEQGYVEAQYKLGYCYYDGRGVAQDYVEAVRWHRKAAEQGHDKAMFSMGFYYFGGHGVAQDYAEAVRWFRKAAEKGNADAQYVLGSCYHLGLDSMTKDYVEAEKWYRKAAEQGHDMAKSGLEGLAADIQKEKEREASLENAKNSKRNKRK